MQTTAPTGPVPSPLDPLQHQTLNQGASHPSPSPESHCGDSELGLGGLYPQGFGSSGHRIGNRWLAHNHLQLAWPCRDCGFLSPFQDYRFLLSRVMWVTKYEKLYRESPQGVAQE